MYQSTGVSITYTNQQVSKIPNHGPSQRKKRENSETGYSAPGPAVPFFWVPPRHLPLNNEKAKVSLGTAVIINQVTKMFSQFEPTTQWQWNKVLEIVTLVQRMQMGKF